MADTLGRLAAEVTLNTAGAQQAIAGLGKALDGLKTNLVGTSEVAEDTATDLDRMSTFVTRSLVKMYGTASQAAQVRSQEIAESFAKMTAGAAAAMPALQKAMGTLQGNFGLQTKALSKGMQETAVAMRGLGQQSAGANMFMQQFAFTIQDTPYFLQNTRMGIMAVSNNIGFLVNQWGMLSQGLEKGQTVWGNLLKTLKGPTGAVVAFSAVIAVVQGLSIAMGESKEATEAANEALEKYISDLKTIDPTLLPGVVEAVRRGVAKQRKETKDIEAERSEIIRRNADALGIELSDISATVAVAKSLVGEDRTRYFTLGKILDQRQKELERGEKVLATTKEQTDAIKEQRAVEDNLLAVAGLQRGEVSKRKNEIEDIKRLQTDVTNDTAQWLRYQEQIETKERELKELLMTQSERRKESLDLLQAELGLGKISVDQAIARLRALIDENVPVKERLEYEKELQALIEKRAAQEKAVAEGKAALITDEKAQIAAKYDAEIAYLQHLIATDTNQREDAQLKLQKAQIDKENEIRAVEIKRLNDYAEAQAKITLDEREAAYIKYSAERYELEQQKQLGKATQDDLNALDEQYNLESTRRDRERLAQIALLQANVANDQEQRINKKYELERISLEKLKNDKVMYDAAIADLEYRQQQEITAYRTQQFQLMTSNIEQLGDILQQAFAGAGDSFLKDLGTALRLAALIAEQMRAASLAKTAAEEQSAWLGALGGLVGLMGLFDKGGYTGNAPASKPVGIVHGGEIVFEKPIVDKHKNELMALRSALKRGYQEGGYVSVSTPRPASMTMSGSTISSQGSSAIIGELRQLRAAVTGLQIQQPIIFRNILDTQRIVRENYSDALKYNERKHI